MRAAALTATHLYSAAACVVAVLNNCWALTASRHLLPCAVVAWIGLHDFRHYGRPTDDTIIQSVPGYFHTL